MGYNSVQGASPMVKMHEINTWKSHKETQCALMLNTFQFQLTSWGNNLVQRIQSRHTIQRYLKKSQKKVIFCSYKDNDKHVIPPSVHPS